jgi:hypothetical protein
MSRVRAPRVGGAGGGTGTTTLATALRGHDRGRDLSAGVEVLACRYTAGSLYAAAELVAALLAAGLPRPVLAVTAESPGAVPGALRARLRSMEPGVAGLVVLPYVPHWRELPDPLVQASRLGDCPVAQLPRPLRGYAEALGALTGAVLRSGLLRPLRRTRPADPAAVPIGAGAVPVGAGVRAGAGSAGGDAPPGVVGLQRVAQLEQRALVAARGGQVHADGQAVRGGTGG